jgi:hypothetical protein
MSKVGRWLVAHLFLRVLCATTTNPDQEGEFESLRARHSTSSPDSSLGETLQSFWSMFSTLALKTTEAVFDKLRSRDSESNEIDLTPDAVLSRRAGSIRNFVVDMFAIAGIKAQSFPVVFDTGSDTAWVISQELGSVLSPPRKGYETDVSVPTSLEPTCDLDYVSCHTECKEWRLEKLSLGSSRPIKSWNTPLCIAKTTSVVLTAIDGVIGADLSSPFTRSFGTFWLVPQERGDQRGIDSPEVGLYLGDRLRPEIACDGGVMAFAHVSKKSTSWRTRGTISVEGFPVERAFASIDTGTNRVHLPKSMWDTFVALLASIGVELTRSVVNGDFYTSECGAVFPTIHLTLGDFKFDLTPELYVIPVSSGRCRLQVYEYAPELDNEILIGAPVLSRVVTRWDSRFLPSIGFCQPVGRKSLLKSV